MSVFSGRQGKGAMREHRAKKRAQATGRALLVKHERTRTHRLGKCSCSKGMCDSVGCTAPVVNGVPICHHPQITKAAS